jgi:hypothetical protein
MGKIYTIVFNSIIAPYSVIGEVFNYDWGQLPNVPYKVSFSLISSIDNLTNSAIAVVYIDLNQQCSIMASPTGQTGLKNNYLGFLRYSGTGATNYLYADATTNQPIYINGRPTNNNVFIEIHTNQAGGMTNYSPTGWEYILTLNLETLD